MKSLCLIFKRGCCTEEASLQGWSLLHQVPALAPASSDLPRAAKYVRSKCCGPCDVAAGGKACRCCGCLECGIGNSSMQKVLKATFSCFHVKQVGDFLSPLLFHCFAQVRAIKDLHQVISKFINLVTVFNLVIQIICF